MSQESCYKHFLTFIFYTKYHLPSFASSCTLEVDTFVHCLGLRKHVFIHLHSEIKTDCPEGTTHENDLWILSRPLSAHMKIETNLFDLNQFLSTLFSRRRLHFPFLSVSSKDLLLYFDTLDGAFRSCVRLFGFVPESFHVLT